MNTNEKVSFFVATHPNFYPIPPLRDLPTDKLRELMEACEGVLAKRTAEDRRKWINSRHVAFINAYNNKNAWSFIEGNTTVVVLRDGLHVKHAMARLAPGDTFEFATGLAVAWAHLHGEDIPDFI